MYSDYHLHSTFSADGNMDMEDLIDCAISKGLNEICITDHVDMDFPGDMVFNFDFSKYSQLIKKFKDKYRNSIEIKKGIELGLQLHITDELNNFMDGKKFDFVIGSIHAVNRYDICDKIFYKGKTKKEVFDEYLEYLYRCIKVFHNFDVLGHLDIIKRYCGFEDLSLDYDGYKDRLDKIFSELIDNGKGIEVNTSGIRYGLNTFHPTYELIKAYREKGGEIITIGSDGHDREYIGYGFENAVLMLKEIGFKYITTFNNRKPVFNSIP